MTVSLVTYRQSYEEIRGLVLAVVGSGVRRLTVIDNSSMPELEAELCGYSPKVCYRSSANIGFGAAHNIAMREAIAEGEDYHVIINPDIVLGADALGKISDFMNANPGVGLMMPKTLNVDGSMQYNCKFVPTPADLFVRYFLPKRWIRKRNDRFMMKDFDYERTMEVPYLCGCMMCFRVSALRDVGLFDERFFMYPEDIDISRRMWSAGWRPTYYPGVAVVHAHAAASYHSFRMLLIHSWNLIRYFNKWGWIFDGERKRINAEVRKGVVYV